MYDKYRIATAKIFYIILHCYSQTLSQIAAFVQTTEVTVQGYKEAWWGLVETFYELSTKNFKIGENFDIVEIDEALLGRKPTYGHGNISKAFKI